MPRMPLSMRLMRQVNGISGYPNSIRNVVPLPGALSTEMRPWWSLTTDCTIARPSPVPCVLVV